MLRMFVLAISLILSPLVLAEDVVKLRNMALIKVGHKNYLQGTAVNTSGRDLKSVVIHFDILKAGRVVGSQEAEVHSVGVEEAWRIWLPIDIEGPDGFRVDRVVAGEYSTHESGVAVQ